jgi:acetoin utilization deacetylase AcuC-like enzyme
MMMMKRRRLGIGRAATMCLRGGGHHAGSGDDGEQSKFA